jgi:hypothetical protein
VSSLVEVRCPHCHAEPGRQCQYPNLPRVSHAARHASWTYRLAHYDRNYDRLRCVVTLAGSSNADRRMGGSARSPVNVVGGEGFEPPTPTV